MHVEMIDGLQEIAIETKDMNVLELACATSSSKIAHWLLKDLKLLHKRDTRATKMLHERMHLYVPCLKRDLASLEPCLQHIRLSLNDVKELLWLMKQV